MDHILTQARQRYDWCGHRLKQQHPRQRLLQRTQQIDQLELRLHRAIKGHLNVSLARIAQLHAQLRRHTPDERLRALRVQQIQLQTRLQRAVNQILIRRADRLAFLGQQLNLVSPLATLDRGYALVTEHTGGKILRRATDVSTGARITARLAHGELQCTVIDVVPSHAQSD
jgi:exodeoxyribonuclease VII large subunit